MIQTLKKYQGPLIECFILSSLMLLLLIINIFIYFSTNENLTYQQKIHNLIPIIFCAAGLILNSIFYSTLKKKYNFELSVFLYGIGFTSCFFTAVYYIFRLQGSMREHLGITYFYLILLAFLYYTYATMFKNTEKRISKVTLFLMVITAVISVVLTIFEIINYQIPYVGILQLFYGLYFAYCLIHKKYVLDLQVFAWIPFLVSSFVFWYFLITRPII
ncbi:hypothetical protein MmiHf6_12220 [Methanimicrococcus hongohii]|uniref:Uncharacterized protein n=1 Tax=Methanimicrococcus hongohii TaxID=3028295 RepID=A0AA96ZSV9_9EURY|nr:hypothetical protein [Methanimicrococcus sp. Hf6]WNY23899.1 hypothetical protein MmiHf6_12220 [Methanimicrococcus sp. Hf6]